MHGICKGSSSIKKTVRIECWGELGDFCRRHKFFASSFKGRKFGFFINIIFSSMSMLCISENIVVYFVRKITSSISWVDQFMSLSEFFFNLWLSWNWKVVPRMSFDFSNGHSVRRFVLKHSIDKVIPFICIGFFTVSEGVNMLFPKMIAFSCSHVFVIRIWCLGLVETRSSNHHNIKNDSCSKQVNFNSYVFFSFVYFRCHVCLSALSWSICLLVWSESEVSNLKWIFIRHKNVFRFKISMWNSLIIHVL